ncbi:bifunctional 3-(3-hydroxy-phenyl)propionate/3-hydroxycinnamic acid hydroxylase [Piscinibacter sakaiensis]|uniref:2-polyprenyl-6-methoxyphenol hydroxylase n=1 Tax=Piscinibacter sakaiensis TaxID=1547922 RepID=A0A0K8P1G8_PISS1|nr:bifunctional 3-(3-hydroxy-phenyl)propionate/3-hydroxycinnamic acid hydroxylase [Piscinibacter sakaiensis]GAP36507.1 2-polyprenyl-6-methoxyphenol hydroxylase [Piscinibacter sakaiensis]
MSNFDVIVVGLGPTGATLAGLLGQAGVSVAAFDRLPDLYPLPRAIGLDHEAMRIVQELGLAERMAPHIASYRPSEYRGMDGQLIKRLDTIPEPHPLSWAPNYVFDQPKFERELRQRLDELPTVKVFLQSEVQSSGQDGDQAWVEVRLGGQEATTRFTCNYLVACDGGSSPIRKRLGIDLEDLDFDEPWLVVDAIVSDAKLPELPQTQVQYCEAARPSTFVVGPGNHRRWEIMLLEGDSLSPEFPEEELWPLLERWIIPGDATLWRAAAYRFHGLVAKEWRRDRILLAGDSAHMTPPFMAQGMVGGMRDAHNLAWKLRRVLAGSSRPTLLDTYEEERQPHMRQTILTAMGLGRIICERDPVRARQRDARLIEAHGGLVQTEFRQNMIPKLEHGIIAAATPLAGSLFPQPVATVGASTDRLDQFTGARVRLVVTGPLSAQQVAAYTDALAEVDGTLVQVGATGASTPAFIRATERSPLIAPWLAKAGQIAALVRPDHCVFGTAASPAGALELIQRLKAALA